MGVEALFEEGGVLGGALDAYQFRGEQVAMAKVTEQALLAGGCYVLEAGTGIGKSFAYLSAIIESGSSALISTGSRTLQDQLFRKDIPLLARLLQRPVQVALLKGRANYLCKLAVEKNTVAGLDLDSDDDGKKGEWQRVIEFAAVSEDGDIANADTIPAHAPVWWKATSTRETCTVTACKHYDQCFLYRARARARNADIVIVNHHLFLSDLRLKEDGVAEILPDKKVVLFDEAHLLPGLAPELFGRQLSAAALQRLSNDLETYLAENAAGAAVLPMARRLRGHTAVWQGLLKNENSKMPAAVLLGKPAWVRALKEIGAQATVLVQSLKKMDDMRAVNFCKRLIDIADFIAEWITPPTVNGDNKKTAAENKSDDNAADKNKNDGDSESAPVIRWADVAGSKVVLYSTPINGRESFVRQWQKQEVCIFTSATLAVGGDFSAYQYAMGLDEARTHCWGSPYDFANQSLLYLPRLQSQPNDADYTDAVVAAALPLIRANGGRAMVLFSSLQALRRGAEILRSALAGQDYEILRQGEQPNDTLLKRFRASAKGVLLGSKSFWQGVDVRGEALSLVVVDKIPFVPPDEPLLRGLEAWRKRRGENVFVCDQLPAATVLMRQAAGRLIRDVADYGVFMVCDTRMHSRGYGKVIARALPPMRRCSDEKTAVDFLQQKRQQRR